MTNTGKIARLPHALREQINQRLLNGEAADSIIKWLHTLNEVWTVIRQQFNNQVITPQNLSEWRTGGFAEWKLRRELTLGAQAPAPDLSTAGQLTTSARKVADHLAGVLAGHYARLVHNWDGEPTEEFADRLRPLSHLNRDICALRKSEHQAAQLKLEEAKLALRQKQAEDQSEAAFLKKLDEPGMRERILNHYNNTPAPNPAPSLSAIASATAEPSPSTAPQSDLIKPNQASSGVGTAHPDLESSAAPSESAMRDNTFSPPTDPDQDPLDIYSKPNPTKSSKKREKEEPIVRGFLSQVNYDASARRNDVHD